MRKLLATIVAVSALVGVIAPEAHADGRGHHGGGSWGGGIRFTAGFGGGWRGGGGCGGPVWATRSGWGCGPVVSAVSLTPYPYYASQPVVQYVSAPAVAPIYVQAAPVVVQQTTQAETTTKVVKKVVTVEDKVVDGVTYRTTTTTTTTE